MHTLPNTHGSRVGVDALPGSRHILTLADGSRVALVHLSGPPWLGDEAPTPLLLVHSVNAAASAFEMAPVALREAARRPVVVIDLPGFGASDKPDLAHTPQRMQQAIAAAIAWTRDCVSPAPVDVMALSLGCEFVAEVVLQQPAAVHSLALISPTGMEARRADEAHAGGATRQQGWLQGLLRRTPLGAAVYWLLTRPAAVRWFLARSWGRPEADPRLLAQALRCAALPGARFAPLDFVAGALFTRGIVERYRALPVPVWVAHGTRGSFTDFGACPQRSGLAGSDGAHPVERTSFDGGAMPHFELPEQFEAAYQRFLHGQRLVEALAWPARARPQPMPTDAIDTPDAAGTDPARGLRVDR